VLLEKRAAFRNGTVLSAMLASAMKSRVRLGGLVGLAVLLTGGVVFAAEQASLAAADEVLQQMSAILKLPVIHPLKKSVRSREEIRQYLMREQQQENESKRYADARALEAFGLLPHGFDLDGFLLRLLTEQVAGLYDPRAQEFYIADWIPAEQQRTVMAHELTHALQDQHFHLRQWMHAARPNDDAEAARQAVVEGSAVAAMLDYELRGLGRSVTDLPDLEPLISSVTGEAVRSPELSAAPPYLRAALLFPYLQGAVFTQAVLKARGGWAGFVAVFARPPVSTREILHPELYLQGGGVVEPVRLPAARRWRPRGWELLDENVVGEFNLRQILAQAGDSRRAEDLAAGWRGDRYAILENKRKEHPLLVWRLRLAGDGVGQQFFDLYASILKNRYRTWREQASAPGFLEMASGDLEVVLWCRQSECLTYQEGPVGGFEKLIGALHWPVPQAETVRFSSMQKVERKAVCGGGGPYPVFPNRK
jgi:hypothetical protein